MRDEEFIILERGFLIKKLLEVSEFTTWTGVPAGTT
jgi:hypothetical protein